MLNLVKRWKDRRILRYATASMVKQLSDDVDRLERAWVEQTEKIQHYFRKAAARERRRLEREVNKLGQIESDVEQQPDVWTEPADRKAALRARFSQRRRQDGTQHQAGEGAVPG